MTEPIVSKAYVLIVSWNETELVVHPHYQDAGSSDPRTRIAVPAGVWMLSLNDETRFAVTPVLVRGDREREYDAIPSADTFQIQTALDAEMYFRLSGVPNTNDARTAQVGVVLSRMGGFDT